MPFRKSLYIIIIILFFIAGLHPAAASEQKKVSFLDDRSLDEITAMLKKENKLGLLYFTGPLCSWCQKLEKEVFTVDSVINYIEKDFISFKSGKEIERSFKVRAVPTIIVINKSGEEINKIFGYFPSDRFIEKLSHSVSSIKNLY